jgi:hypothetical protein
MSSGPLGLSRDAALAGGAKAGQYLQSIGQTDLAKLNAEQFGRFCDILVSGAQMAALDAYVTALEREPPF